MLPAGDVEPDGQNEHAAAKLAAASELKWSAGQVYGIHAESPDAALEVPGGQATHGPPSGPECPAAHGAATTHGPPTGPEKPAMHKQLVLPGGETEFAGQASHCTS